MNSQQISRRKIHEKKCGNKDPARGFRKQQETNYLIEKFEPAQLELVVT
jgi:hypothetical protein